MVENIPVFLIRFAIAVFATYRIAFEVVAHNGPADIFMRWRERIQDYVAYHPDKNLLFLDEILRCATCVSVFVSIPIVLIMFWGTNAIDWLWIWLSINGVIVWVHFKLIGE